MTLVTSTAIGPYSNITIAPGGGGLRDVLVNTGITLAETLITNYVEHLTNEAQKEANRRIQAGSEALRNFHSKRRGSNRTRKPYRIKNFRRTKVNYWRSNDHPKFSKY